MGRERKHGRYLNHESTRRTIRSKRPDLMREGRCLSFNEPEHLRLRASSTLCRVHLGATECLAAGCRSRLKGNLRAWEMKDRHGAVVDTVSHSNIERSTLLAVR